MRARIIDETLYLHQLDVPTYKKKGSVVRNSYFWALQSIALSARRDRDWELDDVVWPALQRMLISFAESGYLGLGETQLVFVPQDEIPPVLKPIATWDEFSWDADPEDGAETDFQLGFRPKWGG